MRKKHGFTLIETLIGLTIIAILAGGVWVRWQTEPKTNQPSTPIPTSTVVVSPALSPQATIQLSSTPDLAVDWKTDENPVLNFSIRYPAGWFWGDDEKRRLQNFDPKTAPGRGYEPVNLDKDRFIILFADLSEYDKAEGRKIDTLEKLKDVVLSDQNTEAYFMGEQAGQKEYLNGEFVKLGNIDAYYVESRLSKLSWPPSREVYLWNDKTSRVIVATLWPNSGNAKEIFMQILSTFQFTN